LAMLMPIGEEVILEITRHGKLCHDRCAIYYQAGDCVMPREGIFAKVVRGGHVKAVCSALKHWAKRAKPPSACSGHAFGG